MNVMLQHCEFAQHINIARSKPGQLIAGAFRFALVAEGSTGDGYLNQGFKAGWFITKSPTARELCRTGPARGQDQRCEPWP